MQCFTSTDRLNWISLSRILGIRKNGIVGGGGGGGVRMFALEKFVTELLNYSQFNGFREGSG